MVQRETSTSTLARNEEMATIGTALLTASTITRAESLLSYICNTRIQTPAFTSIGIAFYNQESIKGSIMEPIEWGIREPITLPTIMKIISSLPLKLLS